MVCQSKKSFMHIICHGIPNFLPSLVISHACNTDFAICFSAAWHGTRIVLRQVSPESIGIFALLLGIHDLCSGDWDKLVGECGVGHEDVDAFLDYGARFLSNLGNYYVCP